MHFKENRNSLIKDCIYILLLLISSLAFFVFMFINHGHVYTPLGELVVWESDLGSEDSYELAGADSTGPVNVSNDDSFMEDVENIENIKNTEDIENTEDESNHEMSEENKVASSQVIDSIDDSLEVDIADDKEVPDDGIIRSENPPISPHALAITEDESGHSWLSVFGEGITPITLYDPVDSHSRYYDDYGILPSSTNASYKTEGLSYFDEAIWIGDSRCLGIFDYSGFNSDFYCDNGYCFYNYHSGKSITMQNNHQKIKIEDALSNKNYKRVYVMMGVNDCGYMTTNDIHGYMSDFVTMVKEKQPEAVIFLCSNLHVSKKIEETRAEYSNRNINAKNTALASLADGETVFYLDFNYLFTDDDGYLLDEITFDGFHMYASQYDKWVDFFVRHGI